MKKGRRRKEDRSSMSRSSKNTPTTTCTSSSFGTGTTFSNSGSSLGCNFRGAQSPQTGGLFSTSTPFGFGQPPNTQNTGLLGVKPSTSLFGQPVLTGQSTGLLGGTPSTSLFGQPVLNGQSTGLFGQTTSASSFGQLQNTQGFFTPFGTSIASPGFGATMEGSSLFGQVQTDALTELDFQEKSSNSGTTVKFCVVQGTDSMVKNGITTTISVKHQCITVMSNYDKKSLEVYSWASSKYGQFYGNHVGHECELITDIANTIREDLSSVSGKLGDHYELVKKSRGKVTNTKEAVLATQKYLQYRIDKHVALLHANMSKGETTLRGAVNDKTNQKIAFLENQERAMSGIEVKCELALSLLEECRKNDSALVDEKPNIFSLVDEVSAFVEKCELEPAETDNLTCYFGYNLLDLLRTQIGGVRILKPGQKETPIYGFNEHEMWGEGNTKDAEVQTEDPPLESTAHHSQDLIETANSGLTGQVWDNSPSDVNEKGNLDWSSDKDDNDDENEVGLEGVMEGETSIPVDPNLQRSTDSQSSGEVIIELLDEILEKVDRLAGQPHSTPFSS
ncbi:Nuclear pore complex protein Nup98-Nup96 [Stylophora pistillata]|uniref:Nuclear pore complex protein Nup98-Nup96 n=1 Tax=Stylophora pistillata TaxID=50429 RepID=A0A2B4S666_STYPI|nr:Nuclear pore complex protein Nup98-Nup96 [Stylophora pistillata]